MIVFLRMLAPSPQEKAAVLKQAVADLRKGTTPDCAYIQPTPEVFSAIPGSTFAYWASRAVLACFTENPPIESAARHAAAGASTKDNLRFVRTLWEVAAHTVGKPDSPAASWVPLAKGGAHSRYYADVHLVVRWANDGRELKVAAGAWRAAKGWGDHWRAELHNSEYYGRPGVTWPVRSQKGFSARALGPGGIFGHKGPTVFVPEDTETQLLALLGLMNSNVFEYLVSLQMAFGAYEVGVIQRTPTPMLTEALAGLARRAWSLKRSLDTTNETSNAFLLPPGLNERMTGLDRAAVERELEFIQRQINETAITLYGIGPEDRAAIEAFSKRADSSDSYEEDEADDDEASEDESPTCAGTDAINSWLIGTNFGRFDPRLATDERAIQPEPKPFDPLPCRSAGLRPEDEVPGEGTDIFVDDDGHADDLVARARTLAERVGVDSPDNLRTWLSKDFFPLHIKMYSKSRRKAPIYWQLATPSASYSVWLYIHAFSKDTLFRVLNDYVAPKLAQEIRRLESTKSELGDGGAGAQRREMAAQEAFVEELRTFLEEISRVAPLWNADLDDGVLINFAPLWRLVPQHKAWQKELKATWDALGEGKYDWAHLAMHLWPERVLPKCETDRSLAIAHGLEDVFWAKGEYGKWQPREEPTRPIDALIAERSSAAVKAALKILMEAPDPSASTKRGRKSKTA